MSLALVLCAAYGNPSPPCQVFARARCMCTQLSRTHIHTLKEGLAAVYLAAADNGKEGSASILIITHAQGLAAAPTGCRKWVQCY